MCLPKCDWVGIVTCHNFHCLARAITDLTSKHVVNLSLTFLRPNKVFLPVVEIRDSSGAYSVYRMGHDKDMITPNIEIHPNGWLFCS